MEQPNTIARCFWCGRPKDSSITEEDIQKKHLKNLIQDYVPCDNCKKVFGNGIHVIGVTKKPIIDGMFPINPMERDKLYPTGSMMVVDEDFINQLLFRDEDKDLKERVLENRMLMLPEETVSDLVDQARDQNMGVTLDSYIDDLEKEESIKDETD